jgi:uncharacterized damage-inducible protein DinB
VTKNRVNILYHKLEDFINDWTIESESTLKVFNNLTDESLTKKVDENVRTAGRLAWHITTAIGEMAHRTGLSFKTVEDESDIPATAKEIVDAYKEASENLVNSIKSTWNDETLIIEDDMYGEMWKRGTTLGVIISHQIHHRAQLTIVMRFNGLNVPGVYGPSKEEWTIYGIPAQE